MYLPSENQSPSPSSCCRLCGGGSKGAQFATVCPTVTLVIFRLLVRRQAKDALSLSPDGGRRLTAGMQVSTPEGIRAEEAAETRIKMYQLEILAGFIHITVSSNITLVLLGHSILLKNIPLVLCSA